MTTRLIGVKGDNIDLDIVLSQDLTSWEIRCEIWDNQTIPIRVRKANSAVSGGDSSQIEVIDPVGGRIQVHFLAGDTTNMKGDIRLEIEVVNTSGKRFTVFQSFLILNEERITWDTTGDP